MAITGSCQHVSDALSQIVRSFRIATQVDGAFFWIPPKTNLGSQQQQVDNNPCGSYSKRGKELWKIA